MIRPDDFEIQFDTDPDGTSVRIRHRPTGNERIRRAPHPARVGRVRDALLAELQGLLFAPDDIRIDVGRSTGGDFIRVTHLPSGIQRTAMRRERSEEDMLDDVLEELFSDPAQLRRVRE